MHEALPNTSPAALSYVALQCSDLGMTLHASSPLCGIVQHRELHQARFDRNEVEFPAPPLLLDCAPGHIPSLAGGAAFVGGTVRVVRTGLDAAAYRKVSRRN